MGNIVLGSVTLLRILTYQKRDMSTMGKKKIPAKSTPTVDKDVTTLFPTEFKIIARVSSVDDATLHSYKGSSQTLSDDDDSYTVQVETVESDYQVGHKLPWKVTISCTQTVY